MLSGKPRYGMAHALLSFSCNGGEDYAFAITPQLYGHCI